MWWRCDSPRNVNEIASVVVSHAMEMDEVCIRQSKCESGSEEDMEQIVSKTMHSGLEQPWIGLWVLSHLLIHPLICSHRSFIYLLHVVACTPLHSIACSPTHFPPNTWDSCIFYSHSAVTNINKGTFFLIELHPMIPIWHSRSTEMGNSSEMSRRKRTNKKRSMRATEKGSTVLPSNRI